MDVRTSSPLPASLIVPSAHGILNSSPCLARELPLRCVSEHGFRTRSTFPAPQCLQPKSPFQIFFLQPAWFPDSVRPLTLQFSQKRRLPRCATDELAGHLEAPNMEEGGPHPQATMMPDPWATFKRPSADEGQTTTSVPPETTSCVPTNMGTFALTKGFCEARSQSATRNVETRSVVDESLDFYVEGHSQGWSPETPRAREHEARRTATKSGALASTCKRSATPSRQKGARVGPLQQSAEFQTQEEGGLRERLRAQGSVQWQG